MHADTEIQELAPGPDNHLAEDDEDPGVKAYRAKRVAKFRKNEAALRLKVGRAGCNGAERGYCEYISRTSHQCDVLSFGLRSSHTSTRRFPLG
jgi:hypothetical protein